MLEFFMSVGSAIRSVGVDVAVAVTVYSRALSPRQARSLKLLLQGLALAQLDDNVKAQSGKYIGRPTLMLDLEGSSRPGRMTDHPYMAWARMVPNTPENDPEVFHAADPTYVATDSAQSRLVQAADIAAYFVAKYLVLFGNIARQCETTTSTTSSRLGSKMQDGNFAIAMWDVLNMAVILVRSKATWSNDPLWLRDFSDSVDRELFDRFSELVETFVSPLRDVQFGRNPAVAVWRTQ